MYFLLLPIYSPFLLLFILLVSFLIFLIPYKFLFMCGFSFLYSITLCLNLDIISHDIFIDYFLKLYTINSKLLYYNSVGNRKSVGVEICYIQLGNDNEKFKKA